MSEYFEPVEGMDADAFDPAAVVTGCIESGCGSLLLDGGRLPPKFFDLSSGLAGELLHRLSTYRILLAAVVPDPTRYSESFQDFVREANRGRSFRFFRTRDEALQWLEGN